MVGNVDEEIEVGADDGDRDVSHYEVPLVGAATEGELHGFVAVLQDASAVGSNEMMVSAWTATAVNLGLREEGSAGACVD